MEALHLALRAAARPGDVIAIESPTYFGVLQTIESLGLTVGIAPVLTGRDALGVRSSVAGRPFQAAPSLPTVPGQNRRPRPKRPRRRFTLSAS